MVKRYLFEYYVILPDGTWSLYKNVRLDPWAKRVTLKELKRDGFVYDRHQKAYFRGLSIPYDDLYHNTMALVITSYII